MAQHAPELETASPFATIEEAIEDIRLGKFVVVVDAPDRENEGDLTIAAEHITPAAINFMATHARGLICLCLTEERCDELGLRPMTYNNQTPFETAFTVAIEAREGVTTGISAADRAHTIQVAIDPSKGPDDLVQPGHIFPLRARPGGVLQRTGQTEASVDLARLAGRNPAGVVCEIANLSAPPRLRDVSMRIHRGEIVGIGGLQGQGQLPLFLSLFGARRSTGGVVMRGQKLRLRRPADALKAGIALIPEDRATEGLCLSLGVRDNISLGSLKSVSTAGLISSS